jgi:hypothetical protein
MTSEPEMSPCAPGAIDASFALEQRLLTLRALQIWGRTAEQLLNDTFDHERTSRRRPALDRGVLGRQGARE